MYPILFSVGKFHFYTHGVVSVFGIVIASLLVYSLAKKRQLDTNYFIDNVIFTVLFGILGARLAYFLVYRDQFSNIKEIINLWDGGLISYGGFLLGGIAYSFFLHKQEQNVLKWLDITAVGFFLGLFIGRIGDLFAGEYNGVRADFSLTFIGATNIVPVSFYEAILCLIIFIISYILKGNKALVNKPGILASFSVIMYSLVRFVLDFWRTEEKVLVGLSPGQITSLIVLVLSSIFAIVISKQRRA